MRKNIKDALILIVDDNAVNRQVLMFSIQKYGIKSGVAENGKIAYDYYVKQPVDLILMDIMMPVMDGLMATKAIRDYEKANGLKNAVIIAVSANIQDEDVENYLSMGLDKISKKPINFKELDAWFRAYFEF